MKSEKGKELTTAVEQALKLLVGIEALQDLAVASLLNFALATTSTKKLCAHIPQLASQLQHPLVNGEQILFWSSKLCRKAVLTLVHQCKTFSFSMEAIASNSLA